MPSPSKKELGIARTKTDINDIHLRSAKRLSTRYASARCGQWRADHTSRAGRMRAGTLRAPVIQQGCEMRRTLEASRTAG